MLTNTKEMNWKSARRFGNTTKYALLVFIAYIASKRICNTYIIQSFRLQQLGQHTRWSSNSLAIHLVCRDEAIRLTNSHAFQIVNLVMEPSQIQSNKAKIRETL